MRNPLILLPNVEFYLLPKFRRIHHQRWRRFYSIEWLQYELRIVWGPNIHTLLRDLADKDPKK